MREKLTKKNEQTGFTIIEVVLVLAIAGLIFLIVFLALPQLQRSRRDTQRKSDAGRFLAALENYAGNNSGDYPDMASDTDLASFVSVYLDGEFIDPSGTAYSLTTTRPMSDGGLDYQKDATCAGGQDAVGNSGSSTNDRQIAVVVYQESGGTACQDNL